MWSRYGVLQICALRFFHVGSIQFDRILIHGNAEKDAKAGSGWNEKNISCPAAENSWRTPQQHVLSVQRHQSWALCSAPKYA